MTIGLVGRKVGMMRIFTDEGDALPVTVLDVSDNRITQIKTPDKDGYAGTIRTLTSFALPELYTLQAQGEALLPVMSCMELETLVDTLAALAGAIADRRGQDNLAARVCGYADAGARLDAATHHTFPRVRGRRG